MYQNLKNYLDEISHYLAVKDGAKEIVEEIKSHILEKTEAEYKTITEDAVNKTIAEYGKPQQVAAKYLEGIEIISPIFKRHLFLYTGVLFICHFILIIAASLLQISMVVFPFLYIPNMIGWQVLLFIPTTYMYDLGLVAIFLYLVTQGKKELRLPWPKLIGKGESEREVRKPKIIFMALLVLIFALFLFMLLRFGTFFFASMNDSAHPLPLFGPVAASYYSVLFLAMLGCEIVGYAVRFIIRSRWLDLIKNFVIIFLLQLVWNSPVNADFVKIPGIDLKNISITFVLIFTVVAAFKFLKSLILVATKQFATKQDYNEGHES